LVTRPKASNPLCEGPERVPHRYGALVRLVHITSVGDDSAIGREADVNVARRPFGARCRG
jgi:hypothetical protein